jgi:hypothetical protein
VSLALVQAAALWQLQGQQVGTLGACAELLRLAPPGLRYTPQMTGSTFEGALMRAVVEPAAVRRTAVA